jgi:16S rRNA U1498 N3-methylase RsmE
MPLQKHRSGNHNTTCSSNINEERNLFYISTSSTTTMMVGRHNNFTNRTCSRRASLRRHPMALVTAGAVICWRHISSSSANCFVFGVSDSQRRSSSLSMPAVGASLGSVATALSYVLPPKPSRRSTGPLRLVQRQKRNLGHFSSHHNIIDGFLATRTTASSSTTTTRRYSSSNEKDTVSDNQTTLSASSYQHLPRVYIEPTNKNNNKNNMSPNALVSLSSSQSHYLQTVMRLSNPKRWGELVNHVRIFNGQDGEWLAKLLVVNELVATSSARKMERRRPKYNNNDDDDNDDDAIMAQCLTCLVPQPPPPLPYHMTLWMPSLKKKERRKWLLEKVTELGIHAVGFIQTDYSEVADANSSSSSGTGTSSSSSNKGKNKYKPSNIMMQEDDKTTIKDLAYMVEAAEQCERFTIPKLLTSSSKEESSSSSSSSSSSKWKMIPNSLSEIVETIWKKKNGNSCSGAGGDDVVEGDPSTVKEGRTVTCWLICRERNPSSCSIFQALENLVEVVVDDDDETKEEKEEVQYDIHILVGPEGGWSPAETQQMEAAIQQQQQQPQLSSPTMILQGVSLGPLILRAETAAITAVGAVMLHRDYYSNRRS